MPRERGKRLVASNKRARFDFFIVEILEAGIVLSGTEVKSLREGKVSLNDSFVVVDQGELWLENAYILPLKQGSWTNHLPRRRRKLLLKKKDILALREKSKLIGWSIVPVTLYFKDGFAKVELALGRGKKSYDKREDLRRRESKREILRTANLRTNL